jgi:hypothetical protein
MSDISPTPNEVLVALLDAHGYQTQIRGERVILEGQEAQLSGETYLQPRTDPYLLQLDVRLHLPDGRTLIESFAGMGRSPKYAMGDAFDTFSSSSFHVLLDAFLGHGHETSVQEWHLPGGRFTTWIGDATFRGQLPGEGEENLRWFQALADAIRSSDLNPQQSHWIRLYYAQQQGQTVICEVLLDNEPWHEVQHAMQNFTWQPSEEFYSARVFLVLQPLPA